MLRLKSVLDKRDLALNSSATAQNRIYTENNITSPGQEYTSPGISMPYEFSENCETEVIEEFQYARYRCEADSSLNSNCFFARSEVAFEAFDETMAASRSLQCGSSGRVVCSQDRCYGASKRTAGNISLLNPDCSPPKKPRIGEQEYCDEVST